jgi:hypothetical protein
VYFGTGGVHTGTDSSWASSASCLPAGTRRS